MVENYYEIVDNFYEWIIQNVNEDLNKLKLSNCEDLNAEYKRIKDYLLKQRKYKKNDSKLKQFDIDLAKRLKIIIECTKKEYKKISSEENKNIVYFNSLIGWYEDIPDEMNIFMESLFKWKSKQTI